VPDFGLSLASFCPPGAKNPRFRISESEIRKAILMAAKNLSDEQLLKRASHAGRNLAVLSILATLAAIAFWVVAFMAKVSPLGMILPALAITFVAAGYCVLTIAARRGNPASVGTVIVIMALQLTVSLIFAGIGAARTGTDVSNNMPNVIIPIVVLVALATSRGVLLELQERGLWEKVFDSEKSSGQFCVIGGIFLAIGFLTLNGGTFYVGNKVQQERAAENRQAREFVEMIKHEEQQFMDAAAAVLRGTTPDNLKLALARADSLKSKCESIRTAIGDHGRLPGILTGYSNGVRQWENGLLALTEKNPDTQRAQRLFDMRDKLRADALNDFNRYFVDRRSVAQR
jgi:hypothetical protein